MWLHYGVDFNVGNEISRVYYRERKKFNDWNHKKDHFQTQYTTSQTFITFNQLTIQNQ